MSPVFAALTLFAAATASAPAAPVATVPKGPPPSLSGAFANGGFGFPLQSRPAFGQLQGLPSASDAAPQCRSACVKNRAVCGDDAECGEQWRQCVIACRTQPR
jgi:hypothetical protein